MKGDVNIKKGACMWCHDHCRVGVYVQNGKILKIDEDPTHPRGQLYSRVIRSCPRARAANEWLNHTDRLRYPLKRNGERGEGIWERITWDQALDEIAEKLKRIKEMFGAEAIATASGTGRTNDEYRSRFFNLLGSPNHAGEGQICWGLSNEVAAAIVGWSANYPQIRPGMTKCILLMGGNPEQSIRGLWHGILEAKKRGAKLIVIDPRNTATAQWADLWLQIRPGTDCALLMSMINIIISEGLYDKEFVDKYCYGFDKLSERAREYSPEKVTQITWVPAEKIREAARMYATNKPAGSYNKMGLEHIPNTVEALHARFILPIITGNVDIRGGDLLRRPNPQIRAESGIELSEKLPPEQKAKALGVERFKLLCWPGYDLIQENVERVWGRRLVQSRHCYVPVPSLFRAMLTDKPYPVKALITLAANPMVTMPNTKLIYKALKRLELHMVMDFWLTPSAELADYVLPAASWLERPQLFTGEGIISSIEVSEEAFPPAKEGEYERRTDFDLWRGLGIRLGQEEHWPWKTVEELLSHRLEPMGCTFKEFITQKGGYDSLRGEYKKYEQVGFATPTGKAELYSTILERLGYDPLPIYYEPPESPVSNPELAKDYPLILITGGRHQPFYHSEHRQIDSLRKQHPEPIMQLHPKTALELGISDGDWVWIETPRGRIRQKCHYFKGIDPRVAHAQHGWWFPELPGEEPWLHGVWESNINVVTDDEPDHCNKISGSWPLRAELCRVYRAKKY